MDWNTGDSQIHILLVNILYQSDFLSLFLCIPCKPAEVDEKSEKLNSG